MKAFAINIMKMRRGSADITIVEDDESSIKAYFRSKKLSFIAIFQSKPRKKPPDGRDSHHSEQEEALRSLDEVIETEKRDESMINTDHKVKNFATKTPVLKDIVTEEKHIEEAVNNRKSAPNQSGDIKYDTIKGFDSFMLY